MTALWWVPAGRLPTVAEEASKLRQLRAEGAGREVFTMRETSAAPAA